MIARKILLIVLLFVSAIALNVVAHASPVSTPFFSVASGDVSQTSVILWAHSQNPGDVLFEYTTSPDFSSFLGSLKATVTDPALPVKVEVSGLTAGTRYYFRVTDSAGKAARGTFRTPASLGVHAGLKFGVSGDWEQFLAPFPSIKNAAERQLDFFVLHGDTIYSDAPSPDVSARQATTLAQYRAKHNENYSTRYGMNTWTELRASTAAFAMIDDHEVTNDFAGAAETGSDARFDRNGKYLNETNLFKNGLQAFQEYMPIRAETYGDTGDPRTVGKPKLYRFREFGSDAALFLIDERTFRDAELKSPPLDQLMDPAQANAFLKATYTPGRTMLGKVQFDLLKADLLKAQADGVTWKFILNPEPIQNFGLLNAQDRYEGYAAERAELLEFITTNQIHNVVYITADFHCTFVNNLIYQKAPESPMIKTDSWEIITGPVAVDKPFGPLVIQLAMSTGLMTQAQKALYDGLPMAAKDALVQTVVNVLLARFRYDLIGLDNSGIDATLLKGGYSATHSYGWTEFDIDADTQDLLVTTYGIPWYTQAQLDANPEKITALTPQIVSQFRVKAKLRTGTL
jgi:alkaline phosphatase D